MTEIRYSVEEVRLEGRRLSGVALRYGDTAKLPWGVDERFRPGAFRDRMADVILNAMHQRSQPLARTGGGLRVIDGPEELRVEADLPETSLASDVLALIRSKVYRGLSVEFAAQKESQEGKTRVIEEARLLGIAVVDKPAYPASVIESMRQRYASVKAPNSRLRRVWL